MTHGELRRLHTYHVAQLIVWVKEVKGWELQFEEGYIDPVRKRDKQGKALITLTQAQYVHNLKGRHPDGQANDMSLFIDGVLITDGSDPRYKIVIDKWLSLHPYCRSGISGNDANHFSTTPGTSW